MDKIKEISTNLSHSFSVSERKNIIITGVVKIESFDKTEFLIETVQGFMHINGENLEVVKLDTKYIENWNLGLDIKILLKTIVVVFMRKGAMWNKCCVN